MSGSEPPDYRPTRIPASEVGRRFGVSRDTVHKISPADLPYLEIGARPMRRYHVDDVAKYERRQTIRRDEDR